MSAESLFGYATNFVLIGWLLLLIVPTWKYTRAIVQTGIIPILLSALYLYLILRYWGSAEGGFDSLAEVMKLFDNPYAALAGWVHFLAFDLWIGTWEAGDAAKNGIHRLIMVPCLLLTFMFGPIGLLLYIVIRTIKTRNFFGYENFRMDKPAAAA